jgi:prepilin-type N-terminal cleavage/methylation domain-containing protein
MVATTRPLGARLDDQRGFTLVEFMIAALIMTIVLGGTVTLATQMQRSYSTELDDAALEQEARYALDWIARDLRSAGSDPYGIVADDQEVWLDPNGGGDTDDSIRIQSDIHDPDGVLDDDGENVTIELDPVARVITRTDANADDPSALAMTDAIFTDLKFTFLNAGRVATTNPKLVAYVQVEVTAQSEGSSAFLAQGKTVTLSTEVRLRTR